MTSLEASPPNGKMRLLSVAFYFGLAPSLWVFCLRGEKRYLKHHFFRSLAISSVLLGLLLYCILIYSCSAYLLLHHRVFYQSISESLIFWLIADVLVHVLFVLWIGVWAAAIVLAVRGSMREIPVIARLARSKAVVSVSFLFGSPLSFALLFLVGAAFHATTLAEGVMRPAPVYMLYDDMGYAPNWVFDLGFYRISRVATARWGRGSVVVAPLSRESLEAALQNGRFVFVASHGLDGEITTPKLTYGPEDAGKARVGENIQFVYIAGCQVGNRFAEWNSALAPAEVISYGRDSYVAEHVWWLWFQGPRRIAEIR